MKVLIVGGGGREHALAWKAAQSPQVTKVFCAPGNAGIAADAECVPIKADDIDGLKEFAQKNAIDLTIVGPELPLTLGITDVFEDAGLKVFGPSKEAAQLEGSKIFAKNIMQEAGIPTAAFKAFTNAGEAKAYIQSLGKPVVVKADGLAAGKGVFPCRTVDDALDAVERIMVKNEFGEAGSSIVVEDFLEGEEASFICFTDGTTVVPLPSSQDHKPIFDDDKGPNTGGMGAYSPAPVITPELHDTVMKTVMQPLIDTLARKNIKYKGIVYAGLMIKDGVPNILEFNVRFGDPETQPILYRLQSDMIELIAAAVDERLSDSTVSCDPQPTVCVVMAAGGYPGSYEKGLEISGLEDANTVPDAFVFHAGTANDNGKIVTSGGRVLGVTARGATIAQAIDNSYKAVSKINWPGAQFRKDIGKKALNR